MRAGVLAEADVVPVPGWPALVVARDFLHAEWAALAELRRQHDWRKIRRKRLRQVDEPDTARGDERAQERMRVACGALHARFLPGLFGHELGSCAVSSRSSVFGLSR